MIQKNRLLLSFVASVFFFSISTSLHAQSPTPAAPSVTTVGVTSITETTSIFNGSISSTGGSSVTQRGFRYGVSSLNNTICENGTFTTGAFSLNSAGLCGAVQASALSCGTTYQYQAYATNAVGTTNGSINTFTTALCPTPSATPTPVALPTIGTPTASVQVNSANLTGSINTIGGAPVTIFGFDYGLTASYGSTTSQSPGPYSPGIYTLSATNLNCGTLYHFRSFASNAGGTINSIDRTFTTRACPTPSTTPVATPVPTISTSNATLVTETTALFNGNISNTGGAGVTISRRGFQYGVGSYSDTVCEDGAFSSGVFSRSSNTTCGGLTGSALVCGTTYQVRAFATNSGGPGYGLQTNVTTNSCPTPSASPSATPTPTPVVSETPTPSATPAQASLDSLSAGSITGTSVVLSANISNIGSDNVSERGFEYGTAVGLGTMVRQTFAPYGEGPFSANISSLVCGTTYYYRAYAINPVGTTRTSINTFVTSACPTPSVTATPVPTPPSVAVLATSSNVTRTSATLTGTITSGSADERGFEYGLNQSYGTISNDNGTFGSGQFSIDITGLSPGRVYNFRAYAKNAGGTNYSDNYTFTTNPSPGNLVGWAWSSNIGWVNLDSISINQTTGDLTGYAWSPNIGWLKFGGLSDFPSGGGVQSNAKINLDSGEITGWIRACSGTVGGETNTTGATCVSMNSRTDGWDGWVELSGQNHTSLASAIQNKFWNRWFVNAQTTNRMEGLRMDVKTGIVSGMAWGGSVVGWLNFNAGTSSIAVQFGSTCSSLKISNTKIRFTALASGGTGSYEYAWNGSGVYANLSSFDKAYSGTGNSTVDLSVREVGKNNPINITCSYTPPTNITIGSNPPCSVDKNAVLVGDGVRFTVGQPSPAGTYSYTWITGDGVNPDSGSNKTLDYTYSNAGSYTLLVSVRNTSNGTSAQFSCGNINVSNKELKLFIGANQNDIDAKAENSKKSYLTKVGDPFALKWINTLDKKTVANPDGYECGALLDNVVDLWSGSWTNANVNTSGVADNDTAQVGTYNLGIRCTSASLPEITDTVKLKVISSTGKEI